MRNSLPINRGNEDTLSSVNCLPSGENREGFRHDRNFFLPIIGEPQAESAACSLLNNKEG